MDILTAIRRLCEDRQTETATGGTTDVEAIWPSELLALITQHEEPFAYRVLDHVKKGGGDYSYTGWVISVFNKLGPTGALDGPVRYVVQDARGLLMIMSGTQLDLGAGS